jgi:hypothetical protein
MRALGFLPLLAVLLVMPIWSCSDDDDPVKPKEEAYKCLEAACPRDNVLFNLQSAYNDRNIKRYDELLDADFIFYFSAADVQGGVVSTEYWSRAAEINACKNIFDPNYSNPSQEPVQDIDLLLVYPSGDDQWTPNPAPDQVRYPGETWYQKIVIYNITVQLPGDYQYVGLNKQAAFVLRAATVGSQQVWRIVTWRDDTGTNFRQVSRSDQAAGIAEDTTWGQVKALYSE